MDQKIVIATDKLTKKYSGSPFYAVKNLNLSIPKGEIYGFLGPNGAGKSTTIKLLLNLIQPTNGSAEILKQDIVKNSVKIRHAVGYLSGEFIAYDRMNVRQFFNYMESLHPFDNKKYRDQLINLFKLNDTKKIGELSKGNRQKVGIIQALMHKPEVLILDEPTAGLDPLMQESFYQLIQDCKKNGVTAFISSHNLTEVKKMCDRVGIIRDGVLITEKLIEDLAIEAQQAITISFGEKSPSKSALQKINGVRWVSQEAANTFTIHTNGQLQMLLKFVSEYTVSSLHTHELDLEREFIKYYETKGKR